MFNNYYTGVSKYMYRLIINQKLDMLSKTVVGYSKV